MSIKVDIIFFDLDGVLIDSREAIRHSLNKIFKSRGFRKLEPGDEELFIGPPLQVSLGMFLNQEGLDESLVESLMEECRDCYGREGIKKTALFQGVPEILEHFQGTGKRMFVTTTKPVVFAEPILERFGIRKYFEEVFGTIDMDRGELEKNEVLDLAFKKVHSNSVVIVGDRKTDIEAGKKHGIKTVGVTYGAGSEEEIVNAKPDAVINRLSELKEVLSRRKE